MSEKIYACLLRLFPSAFRRRYEQEALQLLRERIRNERGFLRRLRLGFDLVADIFRALPQAYSNSYGEVAHATPAAPDFSGIPSFRTLQEQPIRRATFATAALITLTALAAFTYVLDRSIEESPIAANGRMSSIRAVIERLNDRSSGSTRSDDAESHAADTTGLEAKSVSAKPNADSAKRRMIDQALFDRGLVLDFTGRWTMLSRATVDAGTPVWFNFRQEGGKLTGMGGPDSGGRYSIQDGLVAGDSVTFDLDDGGKVFLYRLKAKDGALRGTLSIKSGSGMQTAAVSLGRSQ